MSKFLSDGMNSALSPRTNPGQFATTRWTIVFSAADPDALAAREEFAEIYRPPLYALARRHGLQPADADDLVQTFLSRLIERRKLGLLTAEGGRFRDVLRQSLKNELIDRRRAEHALRRSPPGGFIALESAGIETDEAVSFQTALTPDAEYDARCALALLDAARSQLQREYSAAGQAELFDHLSSTLDGEDPRASHASAANRFGCSEKVLKNKGTALRKRFREILDQLVGATLASAEPAQVQEEIRSLRAALRLARGKLR